LDRSLTYRRHLESLRKKLASRVALLRWLADSGWGAGATTLRKATLALVHSTAEYCLPVWCRSAHTRLIDPTINDALRIVTGCLRPTPANNLPILAGIKPADLRRRGATLSLGRRAMEAGHLLHSVLTCPSGAAARRLKSRHPFRSILINRTRSGWTTPQHSVLQFQTPVHAPLGMTLPRTVWVRLKRLRTGVDVSAPVCTNGVMASSAACECGAEQTVDHVVLHCPIHRPLTDCTV